jgi:hypothetical protein
LFVVTVRDNGDMLHHAQIETQLKFVVLEVGACAKHSGYDSEL